MKKYEYQLILLTDYDYPSLSNILNKEGSLGWKLISVQELLLIFEREILDSM